MLHIKQSPNKRALMLTLVISAFVPAEYEEALKVSSFTVKDSRSLLSFALQNTDGYAEHLLTLQGPFTRLQESNNSKTVLCESCSLYVGVNRS